MPDNVVFLVLEFVKLPNRALEGSFEIGEVEFERVDFGRVEFERQYF